MTGTTGISSRPVFERWPDAGAWTLRRASVLALALSLPFSRATVPEPVPDGGAHPRSPSPPAGTPPGRREKLDAGNLFIPAAIKVKRSVPLRFSSMAARGFRRSRPRATTLPSSPSKPERARLLTPNCLRTPSAFKASSRTPSPKQESLSARSRSPVGAPDAAPSGRFSRRPNPTHESPQSS